MPPPGASSTSTTNNTTTQNLPTDLQTHLHQKHLPPTQTWLTTFLSTQTRTPTPPLPALKQTATFRLLASEITTAIDTTRTALLPTDLTSTAHRHRARVLQGTILVQVLDIEDLTASRWSQIELIEARERGEMTKGREVVRIVEEEGGSSTTSTTSGMTTAGAGAGGMHKLLLVDAAGTRVYGFELSPVPGIGLGMGIGAKVLLKDVAVARGVLLLEGRTVEVLGGKVEALQKVWGEGRKERLRGAVQAPTAAGSGGEDVMDVG